MSGPPVHYCDECDCFPCQCEPEDEFPCPHCAPERCSCLYDHDEEWPLEENVCE